jgi:serine/threonine protein kinase
MLKLWMWILLPTAVRLWVYRALIRCGLYLYGPTNSTRCFRLPFNLYAKVGLHVSMSEANAMRLISACTTIPIPFVVDVIEVPTGAFIVMTRVAGEPLKDALLTMSPQAHSLLASDLKECFNQLRSIPIPPIGPSICGVGGEPFLCYRVGSDPIGPFTTERDLYHHLYERVYLQERTRLEKFAHRVHTRPHRICLSHNDITPFNILIDKNRRLSAIVDWECAAWLPEYWDYTRSYFHRDPYHEWQRLMDDVFGLWPEELEVERELWKYNDPW